MTERPKCKGCDNQRNIVNQKYMLCAACNHDRIHGPGSNRRKPIKRSPVKSTSSTPRKPIRKKSSKQLERDKAYKEIREKKRFWQIERGIYRCFFCNALLESDGNYKADCHHAIGRDGDNMADWDNLFFAHRECHDDYHHKEVKLLIANKWFNKFRERTKKLKPVVYNNDSRRLHKAGVYDDEQFLMVWIPE